MRVSVGLPVRNGGRHLAETIESILAQTFRDFELIISDNASADATEAICRDYLRRDPRIRYERNEADIGASRNYNRVFELARGEFFKWSAHDDLIAPGFLAACVAELERDPVLVLCTTPVAWVDSNGRLTGEVLRLPASAAGRDPARRFGALVLQDRVCADVFGVFRRAALRQTGLMGSFIASDRIFRAETVLLGPFCEVGEPMLLLRDHPERSVRAMPAHHLRGAWFDPCLAGRRVFPHWRILAEYVKLTRRLPSRRQRLLGRMFMTRWLARDSNWARLGADALLAVWPGAWSFAGRLVT